MDGNGLVPMLWKKGLNFTYSMFVTINKIQKTHLVNKKPTIVRVSKYKYLHYLLMILNKGGIISVEIHSWVSTYSTY